MSKTLFKKSGLTSLVFFCICSMVLGQSAISGHLNFKKDEGPTPKIFLAKLDSNHLQNLKYAKKIAWSSLDENGTFSFDRKHISEKDAIYKLYVLRMEKAIADTIAKSPAFILSRSDSIRFHEEDAPFGAYTNSNTADKEWIRLQAFEEKLFQSQLADKEDASRLKSYAKDSLRILMVKLIGIHELEEKQLLEQDIAKNPDYYLALLSELQKSDIPPEQYFFLEKKLAFLTQEIVEQKYAWSKAINVILGFLALGMGLFLVFRRKRKSAFSDLSRQEKNIQTLILQGKTNKEIANELFISLSTVKTHITNIYSKLKVSGRKELLQRFQN